VGRLLSVPEVDSAKLDVIPHFCGGRVDDIRDCVSVSLGTKPGMAQLNGSTMPWLDVAL
jgi:hypothetical protein